MLQKLSQPLHATIFALLASSGAILRCLSAHQEENACTTVESQNEELEVVVNTTKGRVKGFITNSSQGKPVRVFYGIPYAKPPIGMLRFSRPVPNDPWTGVFNATAKPNSCVQTVDDTYGNFSGSVMWNANTNMSEDCLKLNVWTPVPSSKKPLAVLVWIYGGGFYSGTSTLDVYDARYLVSEEDVIVVSMNYRVASLGFLSFGNELVPGNAGLYDQCMALKWVRDNIAAFGGDPNRVTLFGESAGAVSVAMHVLSPLSRGLFERVVLQSASAVAPWGFKTNETAREAARRLAKALCCPEELDNKTLSCLRDRDPKEIVYNETNDGGVVDFAFVPVEDGHFLRKSPQALIAEKAFQTNISVMLGSNLNEGSYFLQYFFGFSEKEPNPNVTENNFTDTVQALYPLLGKPPMDEVLKQYTNGTVPSTSKDKLAALDSITGDYHFTCPVVQWADIFMQAGVAVYEYVFARRASHDPWPRWIGVMHGAEVAFVFGEPFNGTLEYDQDDKTVSSRMMRYWANFAKTGDPNLPENGTLYNSTWPRRTNHSREHLVLDVNETVGCAHRAIYCEFWQSIQNNWTRPTPSC
ncbi:acetylcholinesterase-like isoform X3 [Amblyomma americanum]